MWGRRKRRPRFARERPGGAAAARSIAFRQSEIEVFLERRADLLLALAYAIAGDRRAAEAAFAQAARSALSERTAADEQRSLAHVVFARVCQAARAREENGARHAAPASRDDPPPSPAPSAEIAWLEALESLARTALLLRLFGGLTTAEIADCLQVAPRQVERRLLAAVRTLPSLVAAIGSNGADASKLVAAAELICGIAEGRRAVYRRDAVVSDPRMARAFADATLALDRIKSGAVLAAGGNQQEPRMDTDEH